MPQAAHSGPLSVQEPLPSHRFFLLVEAAEGHGPAALQTPLQIIEGGGHAHVGGLPESVKPSVQVNSQSCPSVQVGMLCSG